MRPYFCNRCQYFKGMAEPPDRCPRCSSEYVVDCLNIVPRPDDGWELLKPGDKPGPWDRMFYPWPLGSGGPHWVVVGQFLGGIVSGTMMPDLLVGDDGKIDGLWFARKKDPPSNPAQVLVDIFTK